MYECIYVCVYCVVGLSPLLHTYYRKLPPPHSPSSSTYNHLRSTLPHTVNHQVEIHCQVYDPYDVLSLSLSLSLFSSIACMREQLAQALASQQALIIERDQAKEQCKMAQDRANKLQKQLDLLRKVHSKSLTMLVKVLGHKGR